MKYLLIVALLVSVVGCATSPPSVQNNVCEIFREKGGWFDDAEDAEKRWGTPIPILMAFVHQESRFHARAKPPRSRILWIIPGPRLSSAYGYSQAKKSTWKWYERETGQRASRANFGDALDFIGWYNSVSRKRNGISLYDARALYLAYHEGHGGYARGSYRKKQWLLTVADKVSARAQRYTSQLASCRDSLGSPWWWPF